MNYLNHVCNFSLSQTTKSEKIIKPFWESKVKYNKPNSKLKTKKFVIKWIKFIVYSFTFVIALWGCFQQFSQQYTVAIPTPGQGLEFGFNPGETGDWRFDLSYSGTGNYWTFTEYSSTFGPFMGWFVYPLAWITLRLIYGMDAISYGGFSTLISMIIILLFMRGISFWPSLKTSLMAEKQLEHQGAISEINAKYEKVDKSDREAKMRKQQELQAYYKRHGMNPLGAFERVFIDTPIFLTIYKLFTIIRPIKTTILFGIWDLGAVPFYSIFQNFGNGGWVYIFLLIIVMPTQFFSQKLPQILSKKRSHKARTLTRSGKKATNKQKTLQNVMMLVFVLFIFILSSGLGVYYFFSALITITQTFVLHKIIVKRRSQGYTIDDYLERFGIVKNDIGSTKSLFRK